MLKQIYRTIYETDHLVSFVWRRLTGENLSFIAGGIAFYTLLSVIPAISALVSLYGLLASPQDISQLMEVAQPFLPVEIFDMLSTQLSDLVSQEEKSLSMAFVVSLIVTLFSAARGMKAMMAGLNLVHGVEEKRPWWKKNMVAYFFTLGGLLLMVISISVIVLVPVALNFLPVPEFLIPKIAYIRWLLLGSMIVLSLLGLYWVGPSRQIRLSWRLLPAALAGGALWLIFSFGFSLFIQIFPSFNKVYGSYGAIVVVMLWCFLSSYAVLLGGALHAGIVDHYRRQSREERT